MSRPIPWKIIFFLCVFFAATAILSPAQTFTNLVNFEVNVGTHPTYGSLVQGIDGNYYGTALWGGVATCYYVPGGGYYGCGTVFKLTLGPNNTATLAVLHEFSGSPNDGAFPSGGLVGGTDGNLYGITTGGGANVDSRCIYPTYNYVGCGTVFKITPAGTLTTLYNFNFTDGANPLDAGLVQDTAGNFYGMTEFGGTYLNGTVFKITPGGTLTTPYNFCTVQATGPHGLYCADGGHPLTQRLVLASDGNFYGTTYGGGANLGGTFFKITPAGTLTTLYSFCSQTGCTDGNNPMGALIQASDGNFYGTTFRGGPLGANGFGTIFKMTPGGALTTLHSFNYVDGSSPSAGLVQGTDGNFYGTTSAGSTDGSCSSIGGCGTVFKITPGGTLTTMHNFFCGISCPSGTTPNGELVQGTDGNFYGTTYAGGDGFGTVFSLSVGLGPFVKTLPTSGAEGTPVIVLGNNLTGATSLTFNGTAATFTVVSSSEIQTTVPAGATTGIVQVTTPGGTLSSNVRFQVPGTALRFVPLAPCRVVDTRNATGLFGGPAIGGKTSRSFTIPSSSCLTGVPSTVAAYSLNVTAVPAAGSLGYLTMWPTGQPQPLVSTLNSYDGRVKANAAIVPAGTGGAISVYVTDIANVVLDINGYFVPANDPSAPLAFFPLTPCRVADTRNSSGPLGGPSLSAQQARSFPILSSSCNIPATAHAYSLNFTAIPHEPLGYLTTWPTGMTQPLVSTLNALTGTVTANAAIVPAGNNGEISVYVKNSSDVVIDINGYFALSTSTTDLSLYTLPPCRVMDTRQTTGSFWGQMSEDTTASGCGVPASAQAVVLNATVVPGQGFLGNLTMWPNGQPQPLVSTLNAWDGQVTSNMAIVPTGNSGVIDVFATDPTQVILDTSGYFASGTTPP